MGISRFASRMREYGATETIGRRGYARTACAIVDGPSLAHALLHQTPEAMEVDDGAIIPRYNYAAIGQAAVDWLDRLQNHGYTVDAIYFDGALPDHKKSVRMERLQSYIDKLVVFKAVHDDLEKAARNSRKSGSCEQTRLQTQQASRSLPPPPFLVFAVVEALQASAYAQRTFVVNGEADELCAAKAMTVSASATRDAEPVAIFTNDSDLVLYEFADAVRVVSINDMCWEDQGDMLTSHVFVPHHLRRLDGVEPGTSLIRPAFLMKLDPHLTYRNALEKAQRDEEAFFTSDFKAFAATYDLTNAFEVLSSLEGRTLEDESSVDSRVSELLQQALRERDRIRQAQAWYATEDTRNLQRIKSDLARGWQEKGLHAQLNVEEKIDYSGTVARDFAIDQKAEELKPADLDLYLPVIFDDTSRATAWKAGRDAREVAMHIATQLCGVSATVYEYKRSGQRIRGMPCEQISSELCGQRLKQWTQDWNGDMWGPYKIYEPTKWRLVIVRMLLNGMRSDGMPLPTADLVRRVLAGTPATAWDVVHLNAQYQAAYFTLRMLKQVLHFMDSIDGEVLDRAAIEALGVLRSLPTVADFCRPPQEHVVSDWNSAVQALLDSCDISQGVERTRISDDKKRSRKKRQKVDQQHMSRNAFALLDEGQEA